LTIARHKVPALKLKILAFSATPLTERVSRIIHVPFIKSVKLCHIQPLERGRDKKDNMQKKPSELTIQGTSYFFSGTEKKKQ